MSVAMADKPKSKKKRAAVHLVRLPEAEWAALQERADAEGTTVPRLLVRVVQTYFRNNPEPPPPPK